MIGPCGIKVRGWESPLQYRRVFVDGREMGPVGARIMLEPGPHVIRVQGVGWASERVKVDLVEGQAREFQLVVSPRAILAPALIVVLALCLKFFVGTGQDISGFAYAAVVAIVVLLVIAVGSLREAYVLRELPPETPESLLDSPWMHVAKAAAIIAAFILARRMISRL